MLHIRVYIRVFISLSPFKLQNYINFVKNIVNTFTLGVKAIIEIAVGNTVLELSVNEFSGHYHLYFHCYFKIEQFPMERSFK